MFPYGFPWFKLGTEASLVTSYFKGFMNFYLNLFTKVFW